MTHATATASIARAAVLVDLTLRVYDGKITDRATQEEIQHAKQAAARTATSVHKQLFAGCAELKAITTLYGQIGRRHRAHTLPWEDGGARLLPLAGLAAHKAEIAQMRAQAQVLVERFLNRYDTIVAAAAFQLGGLFDRSEYPTRAQIARRFSVEVAYSPLPVSGDFRIDIDRDAQEDLITQYESRMQNRVVAVQREAWARLHKTLTHLVDRLTDGTDGTRSRIFDTLVDGPRELCGLLTALNITNDPELERARRQLESAMEGTSAQELREQPSERAFVRDRVQDILSQFDWSPIETDGDDEAQ
jgi:uncharacterized coiled-coil protein SlyX